jgi:hypothetical protein
MPCTPSGTIVLDLALLCFDCLADSLARGSTRKRQQTGRFDPHSYQIQQQMDRKAPPVVSAVPLAGTISFSHLSTTYQSSLFSRALLPAPVYMPRLRPSRPVTVSGGSSSAPEKPPKPDATESGILRLTHNWGETVPNSERLPMRSFRSFP